MTTPFEDEQTASPALRELPRAGHLDSTLALLRDPYRYIAKRCVRSGEDLFETRLMLKKTICMSGAEAAALFYDTKRFMRSGAAPLRLQKTLFGQRGVQTLDNGKHVHRKQMFMALMTPERIRHLGDLSEQHWMSHARVWAAGGPPVDLYHEARTVFCKAVCQWAGVPLPEADVALRTTQLTALFESAGAVGPAHWKGRMARAKTEDWIGALITQSRQHKARVAETPAVESMEVESTAVESAAAENTALSRIAHYRGPDGALLDNRTAAVELLNVLRPTVAVAVYCVLAAHALHRHSQYRARLAQAGADAQAECFAQEVRRFYPFFPAVMARVRQPFVWKGYRFPAGRRVVLDLYGTNHDPRIWHEPGRFSPERFAAQAPGPFTLIPQGGGDHYLGHRCPGEWITLELMKRTLQFLTRAIRYDVPRQDLSIDFTRLPALPRSHFVIDGVKLA